MSSTNSPSAKEAAKQHLQAKDLYDERFFDKIFDAKPGLWDDGEGAYELERDMRIAKGAAFLSSLDLVKTAEILEKEKKAKNAATAKKSAETRKQTEDNKPKAREDAAKLKEGRARPNKHKVNYYPQEEPEKKVPKKASKIAKTPNKVVSKKAPRFPSEMPKKVIPKKHYAVTLVPSQEGKLAFTFSVIAKIPSLAEKICHPKSPHCCVSAGKAFSRNGGELPTTCSGVNCGAPSRGGLCFACRGCACGKIKGCIPCAR